MPRTSKTKSLNWDVRVTSMERGRGSVTSNTSASWPGEGVMTRTRSAIKILEDLHELDNEASTGELVDGLSEGLVEEKDAGVGDEQPGQGHSMLRTAGQMRGVRVLESLSPSILSSPRAWARRSSVTSVPRFRPIPCRAGAPTFSREVRQSRSVGC